MEIPLLSWSTGGYSSLLLCPIDSGFILLPLTVENSAALALHDPHRDAGIVENWMANTTKNSSIAIKHRKNISKTIQKHKTHQNLSSHILLSKP